MDQTGLNGTEKRLFRKLSVLVDQVNENRELRDAFIISHEKYQVWVGNVLQELGPVSSSGDLHLLIVAETALVTADLNYLLRTIGTTGEREISSARKAMLALQKKASEQMDELGAMLRLRQENPALFHRYGAGTRARTKAGDFDKEGLPLDGVRGILTSQSTRLKNKEANAEQLSGTETEILGVRRTNLKKAESLYKCMQRA